MIYALEKTSGSENKMLSNAIQEADSSNIESIVDILLSVDAFQYSRKIAREQSNRAIESLDLIPSSEYKSALRLLCELSLERNSSSINADFKT